MLSSCSARGHHRSIKLNIQWKKATALILQDLVWLDLNITLAHDLFYGLYSHGVHPLYEARNYRLSTIRLRKHIKSKLKGFV